MNLSVIESCKIPLISLDYLKTHLRIEHGEEDDYLLSLIDSTTQLAEEFTSRTFLSKKRRLIWENKTQEGIQEIPLFRPPIIEVEQLNSIMPNREVRAIKRYFLDTTTTVPRVCCSGKFPIVEVIYRSGYGENSLDVPAPLKQAVVLLVSQFYENRLGNFSIESNSMINALLSPYKVCSVR